MAALIAYLASDDADFVQGATVRVDGTIECRPLAPTAPPVETAGSGRAALARLRQAVRAACPLLVGVLAVAAFYWWAASAGRPFGFEGRHPGLYNLLAQALARGQLHLAVDPNPELFERVDPYEPAQHVAALEDASLYRGRYYLYFGVVPVLSTFLPWRLLAGADLPQPAAALVFAAFGFLFSALLLQRLLREHVALRSQAALLGALVVLGTTNVVPFLLRTASVYEVAVAAGFCFSSAAAWLFTTAGDSPGNGRLALGGLCLGLAVGCRPNLIVLAPFLGLLPQAPVPPGLGRRLKAAAAALLPLAACLLLLGAYNHARFGSWTEFGARYQLVGARRISRFDYRAVAPVLYYEFLAPPTVSAEFPPLRPFHPWPFGPRIPDDYFIDERTTGALLQAPFLLVLCAAPWIVRRLPLRAPSVLRRRLLGLVAAGLALPLLTSFAFASAAMRFEADFLSFLLVPALVLWSALLSVRPVGAARLCVAAALFGWAGLSLGSLSLAAGNLNLRRLDPRTFAALERCYEPLRVALGRLFDRDGRAVVRLRVAFPERPVSPREPLLSWGEADRYDVLWCRQARSGELVLQLDTADARSAESSATPGGTPTRVEPRVFHDLTIDLDRVRRRVSVAIDGRTPFELSGRLVAVDRNRVWIGRGPRGHDAPQIGVFSGTPIPEAMVQAGAPGLETLPAIVPSPAILVAARGAQPPAEPGQLRVVAGRRGADIWTAGGWRWIPTGSPEAVRLDQLLPPLQPGVVVPVLVSGDAAGADAVFARHLGRGRLALAVARWAGSWTVRAATRPIDSGRLRVTFDRAAGRVGVEAGGREVLRADADLLPLAGNRLSIARLPPGLDAATLAWSPAPAAP